MIGCMAAQAMTYYMAVAATIFFGAIINTIPTPMMTAMTGWSAARAMMHYMAKAAMTFYAAAAAMTGAGNDQLRGQTATISYAAALAMTCLMAVQEMTYCAAAAAMTPGKDKLVGGVGDNVFVLDPTETNTDATNADRITDYLQGIGNKMAFGTALTQVWKNIKSGDTYIYSDSSGTNILVTVAAYCTILAGWPNFAERQASVTDGLPDVRCMIAQTRILRHDKPVL